MADDFLKGNVDDILTDVRIENLGGKKRRLHIMRSQDLTALLEENEEMRNYSGKRHRNDRQVIDELPVCNVPMSVVLEWKSKYGFDLFATPESMGISWQEKRAIRRKLLNMPEYAYCKTFNGRL